LLKGPIALNNENNETYPTSDELSIASGQYLTTNHELIAMIML